MGINQEKIQELEKELKKAKVNYSKHRKNAPNLDIEVEDSDDISTHFGLWWEKNKYTVMIYLTIRKEPAEVIVKEFKKSVDVSKFLKLWILGGKQDEKKRI